MKVLIQEKQCEQTMRVPRLSGTNKELWKYHSELFDLKVALTHCIRDVEQTGLNSSKELTFLYNLARQVKHIFRRLSTPTSVKEEDCINVIVRTRRCVVVDLLKGLRLNEERVMLLELEWMNQAVSDLLFKGDQEDGHPVKSPLRLFSRLLKVVQIQLAYAALGNDQNALNIDIRYFEETLVPKLFATFFINLGFAYENESLERKDIIWSERAALFNDLSSKFLKGLEEETQKPNPSCQKLMFYAGKFQEAKRLEVYFQNLPKGVIEIVYPDDKFKTLVSEFFPVIFYLCDHAAAA